MISGTALVSAVITIVCLGLVFWLLTWLLDALGVPEPFRKVGHAILAIAAVIVLISVLMGLAGHPLVRW